MQEESWGEMRIWDFSSLKNNRVFCFLVKLKNAILSPTHTKTPYPSSPPPPSSMPYIQHFFPPSPPGMRRETQSRVLESWRGIVGMKAKCKKVIRGGKGGGFPSKRMGFWNHTFLFPFRTHFPPSSQNAARVTESLRLQ